MWINAQGDLYGGDCAAGDREATAAEIAAWQTACANIVPAVVRNWQGLAVMQTSNLADGRTYDAAMRTLIAALPAPQDIIALAAYQSADFGRSSPLLNQLFAALSLTQAQIDALFVQAAAINI
jgi:hypothetical protein